MLSGRKAVVAMQVEGKTKFNQSVSAKASPMRIGGGGGGVARVCSGARQGWLRLPISQGR